MNHCDENAALEFLRGALPAEDRISLPEAALRRVVRHALAVREQTAWGETIPEDIFLPFVLFPRINNEDPVFYHGPLWERLKPRVAGLSMGEAVLAVNRWCFEQATYRSTDGRTTNALTVIRRGYGRCGEESVLLVSALRACGIPARQIYVPLWSHCDDNHAWVEAWVDGTWRYLGACEPELSLDSGWFTAAASRAMLAHTRAWGLLPAGERCERRACGAYILNRTAAYADTALLTVRATENGAPRPGLDVDFQLFNMGDFRSICRKQTDEGGEATLLTGLGTCRVHLTDGVRQLELDVDATQETDYEVDFGRAGLPEEGEACFEQRPPRESRMQPAAPDPASEAAHRAYLEQVERARAGKPRAGDPLVRLAEGNGGVIAAFLAEERFEAADRRALLESLREKDLADATAEMLEDALAGALPYRERYPREVWVEGVLCPRAGNELLAPARRWIREHLPPFDDPAAVWRDLTARVEARETEPANLLPDVRAALEHGVCSAAARDVLFVAVCRANGLAARLDPATGEKRVWADGAYRPLPTERRADAILRLVNGAERPLAGEADFSVSAYRGGMWRPLELGGVVLKSALELPVAPGTYRVTACAREIDGVCVGRARTVALHSGQTSELSLRPPERRTAEKLLWTPLPPLRVKTPDGERMLPAAGRDAIVAVVAPGQEPTEHFLNELLDARERIGQAGIDVWLVLAPGAKAEDERLRQAMEIVRGARRAGEPDEAALAEWRRRLNARELRLPLAAAVSRTGEGLFAFVNYNVGSVAALIDVIAAAQDRDTGSRHERRLPGRKGDSI